MCAIPPSCTFSCLQIGHPTAAAGAGPPPDPADSPGAHLHPSASEQTGRRGQAWGWLDKALTAPCSRGLTMPAPPPAAAHGQCERFKECGGRWEPEVGGPGVSKEPASPPGTHQCGPVPGEGLCHPCPGPRSCSQFGRSLRSPQPLGLPYALFLLRSEKLRLEEHQ